MTGLELLVGVVLGGLVAGLHYRQRELRTYVQQYMRDAQRAVDRDVGAVEALVKDGRRFSDAALSRIGGVEETHAPMLKAHAAALKEHEATITRLAHKAGVPFKAGDS